MRIFVRINVYLRLSQDKEFCSCVRAFNVGFSREAGMATRKREAQG